MVGLEVLVLVVTMTVMGVAWVVRVEAVVVVEAGVVAQVVVVSVVVMAWVAGVMEVWGLVVVASGEATWEVEGEGSVAWGSVAWGWVETGAARLAGPGWEGRLHQSRLMCQLGLGMCCPRTPYRTCGKASHMQHPSASM
jgi:hypothetical protein